MWSGTILAGCKRRATWVLGFHHCTRAMSDHCIPAMCRSRLIAHPHAGCVYHNRLWSASRETTSGCGRRMGVSPTPQWCGQDATSCIRAYPNRLWYTLLQPQAVGVYVSSSLWHGGCIFFGWVAQAPPSDWTRTPGGG